MLYEHWRHIAAEGDAASDLFIEWEERQKPCNAWLTKGQELVWTVEADSYADAMRLYHEHMGWEPYVPIGDE